jgi:hypothetical protein
MRTPTMNSELRRLMAGAILLMVLISVACSSGSAPTSSTPVRELRSISELQDRFNADSGAIRLILLVSPT